MSKMDQDPPLLSDNLSGVQDFTSGGGAAIRASSVRGETQRRPPSNAGPPPRPSRGRRGRWSAPHSNIIECRAGDRLLEKGGVAPNLFLVLEGTVEVRDGETPLAMFGPGDVFGEMAFLLERPRSRDVYPATDGVRVLRLSEAALRQLITSDPATPPSCCSTFRRCCASGS